MNPSDYPRRILLAVTGLSPQIVTETLYALGVPALAAAAAVPPAPTFLPTEVRLITTVEGADRARVALLHPDGGQFHSLLADFPYLGQPRFDDSCIHQITGPDGKPLTDIRSPEENAAAADSIAAIVREITADPDCALHVSIAGGRKTMGFYLGYALSLFARPQDRLSHVLVSAPFESHREFYYPSLGERPIHVKQGDKEIAYDCQTAQVDLAWIPFVRLRAAQHRPLVEGQARFTDCVNAVQEALAERELIIDLKAKRIRAGGTTIRLPPTELAFLSWFARRAKAGLEPLPGIPIPEEDPEQRGVAYREPFMAELKRIDALLDEHGKTMQAIRHRITPDYFNAKNSKLNRTLKEKLGALAARPYLVLQESDGAGYALALAPEAIRYGAVAASP